MSNTNDINDKDLKRLEDEAYFELRQIIEEAMQLQDIELLNSRIASWKNKYKKLLDRPSTSSKSDFKKRIEFLLNQYYSSVTQYILNQLKLKEEKKIQNQAKALRELYNTIKNTNDYDLLKKKVKKWKEKYPVSGFLRMYQKRVELYTRDKNLRENAFKQEEAFRDLVDITKKHATLDELKEEVELWEKKYSINNKYSIDDFIKHQSDVKRFISDEFLISIARDDPKSNVIDENEIDLETEYNNKSFSNLSVQANSYAALLAISRSPNNVNEMFRWVYKNSHIKFNDTYKELILSATYLNYSPTYLNKLPKPKMDMSKSSLSFDEYKNMDNIKRYAIISYLNLLLPPDKAISNDYFNKHIQVIYSKSERARVANHIKDDSTSMENVNNSGIEIPLTLSNQNIDSSVPKEDLELNIIEEKPIKENDDSIVISSAKEDKDKSDAIIDILDIESDIFKNDEISQINEQDSYIQDEVHNLADNEKENENEINDKSNYKYDITIKTDTENVINIDDDSDENKVNVVYEEPKTQSLDLEDLDDTKGTTYIEPEQNDSSLDLDTDDETLSNDDEDIIDIDNNSDGKEVNVIYEEPKTESLDSEDLDDTKEPTYMEPEQNDSVIDLDTDEETLSSDNPKSEFDYATIVTLSPMFFSAINNYDKQAVLINHIDSTVTKYIELEKSKSLESNTTTKIKNNLE